MEGSSDERRGCKEKRRLGLQLASPCIARYVLGAADAAQACRLVGCKLLPWHMLHRASHHPGPVRRSVCMRAIRRGGFALHEGTGAFLALQRPNTTTLTPPRSELHVSSTRRRHWRTPGTTCSRGRREVRSPVRRVKSRRTGMD